MRRRRRGGPARLQQQQQLVRQRLPARDVDEVVACGGRGGTRRGSVVGRAGESCGTCLGRVVWTRLGRAVESWERSPWRLKSASSACGERWGDKGRFGEIWRDMGRYGEIRARGGAGLRGQPPPPLPFPLPPPLGLRKPRGRRRRHLPPLPRRRRLRRRAVQTRALLRRECLRAAAAARPARRSCAPRLSARGGLSPRCRGVAPPGRGGPVRRVRVCQKGVREGARLCSSRVRIRSRRDLLLPTSPEISPHLAPRCRREARGGAAAARRGKPPRDRRAARPSEGGAPTPRVTEASRKGLGSVPEARDTPWRRASGRTRAASARPPSTRAPVVTMRAHPRGHVQDTAASSHERCRRAAVSLQEGCRRAAASRRTSHSSRKRTDAAATSSSLFPSCLSGWKSSERRRNARRTSAAEQSRGRPSRS